MSIESSPHQYLDPKNDFVETYPESKGNLEIIYCQHNKENLTSIVESVGESDIVAIEAFGLSYDERLQVSSLFQTISPRVLSNEEYLVAQSKIRNLLGGPDDSVMAGLCYGLIGSDKQVYLIDAATDDHTYEDTAYERVNAEFDVQTALLNYGTEDIENAYLQFMRADAAENQFREKKMAMQIEELISQFPDANISAIMGAVHTPVSHRLRGEVVSTRKFIVGDTFKSGKSKVNYPYMEQATRTLSMKSGNLPHELLMRSIVENIKLRNGRAAGEATKEVAELQYEDLRHELITEVKTLRSAYREKIKNG